MRGTALAGLRRFDESYECLNTAFSQAVNCTDSFGQQAVYSGRVRALLHEGRVTEACALEPPDLSNSLPGMRGEVWSSRGLALACHRSPRVKLGVYAARSIKTTRAVESTILARCITAVTALKTRSTSLPDELRELVSVAWDAGAVDCVVTSYRASPDTARRPPPRSTHSGNGRLHRGKGGRPRACCVDRASTWLVTLDPVSFLSAREREVYDSPLRRSSRIGRSRSGSSSPSKP